MTQYISKYKKLSFATTWINQDTMLNKTSQVQKDKYYRISHSQSLYQVLQKQEHNGDQQRGKGVGEQIWRSVRQSTPDLVTQET